MHETTRPRSAVDIVRQGAQARPVSRQLRDRDSAARGLEDARPSASIAAAAPTEDRAAAFQSFLQGVLKHHADWRRVMTATQISSADIHRARTSFDDAIAQLEAALLPRATPPARQAAASPYFTEEADGFDFIPSAHG